MSEFGSVSILVNTCDAYADAWPMFFYLLKENWPGHLPKVYLNTESLSYVTDDLEVNVLNVCNHSNAQMPWGRRLLDCLSRIDSDYVLLLLEDFYFEREIPVKVISECIRLLDSNVMISHIQLVPAAECMTMNDYKNDIIPGLVERQRFARWRIIAGPTLWRKSDLIRLTFSKDSPWSWEFAGTRRTWLYHKIIYCWHDQKDNPIFDYDIIHGGAIHRGKWVGYKMKELEAKYNVAIEYGNREIENDWLIDYTVNKVNLVKKVYGYILRRIKTIPDLIYGFILNFRNS